MLQNGSNMTRSTSREPDPETSPAVADPKDEASALIDRIDALLAEVEEKTAAIVGHGSPGSRH